MAERQQSQQRKWRVALVQGDIKLGEPEENRRAMQELLERAVQEHPDLDLAVLPEMWNTGYALERIDELADTEGKATREWLSALRQTPHSYRRRLYCREEGRENLQCHVCF
ncbi:hypothetical protein HMSSN036_52540 [Paenibacillus macerans]|nr:hypothetical protein HMSSN036_52540 [Paenibacillus macerans]